MARVSSLARPPAAWQLVAAVAWSTVVAEHTSSVMSDTCTHGQMSNGGDIVIRHTTIYEVQCTV